MFDIKAYLGAFVVFLILDGTWRGVLAKGFYAEELGDRVRARPNTVVVGLFHLVYAAAIVVLAIQPGLVAGAWKSAAFHGAVLGFIAAGSYNVTNYASLDDWPARVAVVDIVWGTLLTAMAATAGFLAAHAPG